jgi:hypothetical protein
MLYTADGWDELGNRTIVYSDVIVPTNQSMILDDISFTVPTDGRARSTPVQLWIYTNKPYPITRAEGITVVSPTQQHLMRTMDNIVVLLTVAAILAILGAIIIASAVFLSARRPNITQ